MSGESSKRALQHVALHIVKQRFVMVAAVIVLAIISSALGATSLSRINQPPRHDHGKIREYWIAVVPQTWNIMPSGMDGMTGQTYTAKETTTEALIYRQYSRNWEKVMPDQHGGQPGPTLYGEVGETLVVHFKNMDTYYRQPHSMHPHGVHYAPQDDGSFVFTDQQPGSAVPVGGSYTYHWTVGGDSVGNWVYHDHAANATTNTTLGMYGLLQLVMPGAPKPDKQMIVFFNEMSPAVTGLPYEFDTINGRAFVGNTPVYKAKVGERVEWVVAALGTEFHAFHIHGHRWQYEGRNQDELTMGPAEAKAISFVEDSPGTWLVHCHVDAHMMAGMTAQYEVSAADGTKPATPDPFTTTPTPVDKTMNMTMDMD